MNSNGPLSRSHELLIGLVLQRISLMLYFCWFLRKRDGLRDSTSLLVVESPTEIIFVKMYLVDNNNSFVLMRFTVLKEIALL